MILIADSGSTKTDWCLVEQGRRIKQLITKGINPFFQTEADISAIVGEVLMPELNGYTIDCVWFYGAGCAFAEKNELVRAALARFITCPIAVGSDLLAAARALCGREWGIACIMGTGSNSCFYNGNEIVRTVSPLGFILGDEGSGAVLGKLLIGDCLKNQLPPELIEQLFTQYELTPALILERVYKQPFPNRFLAGLTPFLAQHIAVPEIHLLVLNSFNSFFVRNMAQYDYARYPVHFIGSVAYYFREVLEEAARQTGIRIGIIEQSPMVGLIEYHTNKTM